MSPEDLLNKLESLGQVDTKILGKLRRKAEDTDKGITVKKILSFLVKNQYMTKEEAIEIKKSLKLETKIKMSGGRNTDDLVAGVADTSAPVQEAEVAEIDDDSDEVSDAPTQLGAFDNPAKDALDDKTLVLDPMLEELPDNYDALTQHGAAEWDTTVPEAAPGKAKIGFDGKLDSSDQWATKWIFIGFGILGLLLVAGVLLSFVLSMITSVDRFEAAMQSFEDGTYGDAIKKFDEFLEKHGSHEKAPIARVTRVQALLADTFKQKNWDETIVRAENELPPLVEDDNIDLETIRQDLAVILPNSTLAMAKRATKQDSKSALIEQLKKAKNAKTLVDNPIYIPNSRKKQATVANTLEKIDEEIAKAEILIKKQDDFEVALKEIVSFRDQGQTDKAFSVYNGLIRSYGDLRANEQLREEIRQVSELEAQLVKAFDSSVSTSSTSRPSPIESSVILSSQTGAPIPSLSGKVIPVRADGSVYGIDLGDGAVRWRTFVGYQTNIDPLVTESDQVLISDQNKHDLILVDGESGEVIWRNEIGEAFLEPQVDGEHIFLTAESGVLRKINLADGSVQASVKIPQNADVPMVRYGRQGALIQPGSYSNLYILSEEDMNCMDVIYTGHVPGSLFAKPVVWNSFILICVNTSGACDLYVLRPEPETKKIELVQRIRPVTRGIVRATPTRFGRFMLVNSEEGDLKILEADSSNDTSPIRILDAEKFENGERLPTSIATSGSQMWIASDGIMRYKVSRSLGTFDRQVVSNANDSFIGPIRKVGDSIIHVRKRSQSSLTSVSAVDALTLKEVWRTDIGGPLAGPPMVLGDQIAAVSSQGDLFRFNSEDSVASDEVKSSNVLQNLLFDQTISLTDKTSVCLGPTDRSEILYVDTESNSSKLVRLPEPADRSACRPIRIGTDLVFPSSQGQVVRVNPESGRIVGAPFLPPVNPGTAVQWRQPATLDGDRFVIGVGGSLYLIDASDKKLLRKVSQIDLEGSLKSAIVGKADSAFAVFQSENSQKLMSFEAGADNLVAGPAIDLPSKMYAGPWIVGQSVMLQLENGNLHSFDLQLSERWSIQLPTDTMAAPPVIDKGSIKVFFGNGKLLTLAENSGEIASEIDLGQPIVHLPAFVNGKTIFSGRDGTVHQIDTQQ